MYSFPDISEWSTRSACEDPSFKSSLSGGHEFSALSRPMFSLLAQGSRLIAVENTTYKISNKERSRHVTVEAVEVDRQFTMSPPCNGRLHDCIQPQGEILQAERTNSTRQGCRAREYCSHSCSMIGRSPCGGGERSTRRARGRIRARPCRRSPSVSHNVSAASFAAIRSFCRSSSLVMNLRLALEGPTSHPASGRLRVRSGTYGGLEI